MKNQKYYLLLAIEIAITAIRAQEGREGGMQGYDSAEKPAEKIPPVSRKGKKYDSVEKSVEKSSVGVGKKNVTQLKSQSKKFKVS